MLTLACTLIRRQPQVSCHRPSSGRRMDFTQTMRRPTSVQVRPRCHTHRGCPEGIFVGTLNSFILIIFILIIAATRYHRIRFSSHLKIIGCGKSGFDAFDCFNPSGCDWHVPSSPGQPCDLSPSPRPSLTDFHRSPRGEPSNQDATLTYPINFHSTPSNSRAWVKNGFVSQFATPFDFEAPGIASLWS